MQEKPVKTKTIYPVSVDEAKRALRVDADFDLDNDYIRNLIYAATQKAEEYIGKDIALTSNVLKIWNFSGDDIVLEEGNFNSLTSVQQSDASTSISVSEIRNFYNYTLIELEDSAEEDPLYVNYVTGFSANECPALIKQAILVKVGDLYDEERSSYNNIKNTGAWERLLDSYKIVLYA